MSPKPAPAFQRQQLAFTAHIRDPEANPIPDGITARRMGVYVELLFNNINDLLTSNFPVLRQISEEDYWCDLVRDFMRRHESHTPLFTEIGQEFLDYLQHEHVSQDDDWPFMLELAHYEYVELAVAIRPECPSPRSIDPNGDLLQGVPVVAPTAWPLTYTWPVHQIGPDYLPDAPPTEPTQLIVYRDRLDEVHFLQVNAVTQRLLQLAQQHVDWCGLELLESIAVELGHPAPDTVIASGEEILEELRQRNVVLGTAI